MRFRYYTHPKDALLAIITDTTSAPGILVVPCNDSGRWEGHKITGLNTVKEHFEETVARTGHALGETIFTDYSSNLIVANTIVFNSTRLRGSLDVLDLGFFMSCLRKLQQAITQTSPIYFKVEDIHIPEIICCKANVEWNVHILPIIKAIFSNTNRNDRLINIHIYK